MKVQIISSFGAPGCTPFAVGEEVEVSNAIAKVWIAAERAISLETESTLVPGVLFEPTPVVAQTAVNTRETTVAKHSRKQTR